MKLKTDIGQVLLTHAKDESFTTLFTEAFQKQGETIELFAVIEIENLRQPHELRLLRADCEKLAGTLVGSLKKIYITSPAVDVNSFEKALAHVNSALSRALRAGKTNWFSALNVCLGAIYKNELSVSTSGNARALLVRGGEVTTLSDDLAETVLRPTKIFSNYSSGRLTAGDRILISTNQLFNYLSFERLQEYLAEDTVAEACQEIIAALKETKTAGFAAFVLETGAFGKSAAAPRAAAMPAYAAAKPRNNSGFRVAGAIALSALELLWSLLRKAGAATGYLLAAVLGRHTPRRGKKWLFAIIAILLVALLANVAIGAVRKSMRQRQTTQNEQVSVVEKLIQDAEAALIYKDAEAAAEKANEAAAWLTVNSGTLAAAKKEELEGRLQEIKNKLSKVIAASSTVLATFAHVPTDLVYSPNGVLAWNRASGAVAFYDFRTGSQKPLLTSQNTGKLVAAAFAGGDHGYVFFDRDGKFSRLDLTTDKLADYSTVSSTAKGSSQMTNLGAGAAARLYLLDENGDQIWRVRMSTAGASVAEPWLKTTTDLANATDMAVDGSIYLLQDGRVEKYFNGAAQAFELAVAVPALREPAGIFATDASKSLYVLDPQQNRLLVYDKAGKFESQFTSDKFHDAADLYVDEAAKIIYIISGSELLQVTMP